MDFSFLGGLSWSSFLKRHHTDYIVIMQEILLRDDGGDIGQSGVLGKGPREICFP